jgi:hypothetical protein
MPDWGISGAPSFGMRDAKVATRLSAGIYGPMVDVPSVQLLNIVAQMIGGELPGDDAITDSHSQVNKGQARIRFGSVSLAVLEKITGMALASSGSTPNRVRRMKFSPRSNPYFGLCGKMDSTNGTGDIHVWCPQAKIVSEFTAVQGEYGTYTVPELTVDLISDAAYVNTAAVNEVQTVTISGSPTGGTFTLRFNGATTSAIAYNAASSAVQTALQALSTIGTGNATVSGSAGGPYTVTFAGTLAGMNVPLMVGDGALLTGGSAPAATVTIATEGVEVEGTIFEIIEHETKVAITIPPV